MTDPTMMEALAAALPILAKCAGITAPVFLMPKDGPAPQHRHLLAWTYPADSFLEGPGGSIAIAIHEDALHRTWPELLHILAHEVGHAKHDLEAIGRGEAVGELAAEAEAERLLRECSAELAEIR